MLSDIENGKINCVITKDLSRLGRNYLETGGYTEIYFPEHNCRYIAITDGMDTAKGSTMDITPFKNLLNDMYAQDISKKIKSSVLTRQKQGKFTGGKAPYGYKKDPADNNHLVIDERYAPTVRRIYDMAENGLGIERIAKELSAEKIRRPGAVAAETHANFEKYANDGKEFEWSFLPNVDQSTVDRSTEEWLEEIYQKLDFDYWYAGHFHVESDEGRVRIMFEEADELG